MTKTMFGVSVWRTAKLEHQTRPVRRDGIAPWGTTAPNQFSILNNEIYCGIRGVTTLYLTESEIIGNKINILPTTAGATDTYNHGIYITGASGNTTIEGNTINCLKKLLMPVLSYRYCICRK